MSIVHERLIYRIGSLVEIIPTSFFSIEQQVKGKVGIITRAPVLPGTLFEVKIGTDFFWVEQSDMKIIAEP